MGKEHGERIASAAGRGRAEDRGLFTLVYIDDVKLGSRQTLKENRDLKGILAPAAKVRMGSVLFAHSGF